MCGINGILGIEDPEKGKLYLAKMNTKMAHRGPDDEGMYVDVNIAVGQRRLSIIDLSSGGHQPMSAKELKSFPDTGESLAKRKQRIRAEWKQELPMQDLLTDMNISIPNLESVLESQGDSIKLLLGDGDRSAVFRYWMAKSLGLFLEPDLLDLWEGKIL